MQVHQKHNVPILEIEWWVAKWHRHGNQFDNILIHWDQVPQRNSWVCQHGCCSAKLLYAFYFSNKIHTVHINTNGSIIWWKVHHDLLLVETFEYLSSVMANSTHTTILCQDMLQRMLCRCCCRCYTNETCSELWRYPILTQLVSTFGII